MYKRDTSNELNCITGSGVISDRSDGLVAQSTLLYMVPSGERCKGQRFANRRVIMFVNIHGVVQTLCARNVGAIHRHVMFLLVIQGHSMLVEMPYFKSVSLRVLF